MIECTQGQKVTLRTYNDLAKKFNEGLMILCFVRNGIRYGIIEWKNRPLSIHRLQDIENLENGACGGDE